MGVSASESLGYLSFSDNWPEPASPETAQACASARADRAGMRSAAAARAATSACFKRMGPPPCGAIALMSHAGVVAVERPRTLGWGRCPDKRFSVGHRPPATVHRAKSAAGRVTVRRKSLPLDSPAVGQPYPARLGRGGGPPKSDLQEDDDGGAGDQGRAQE